MGGLRLLSRACKSVFQQPVLFLIGLAVHLTITVTAARNEDELDVEDGALVGAGVDEQPTPLFCPAHPPGVDGQLRP